MFSHRMASLCRLGIGYRMEFVTSNLDQFRTTKQSQNHIYIYMYRGHSYTTNRPLPSKKNEPMVEVEMEPMAQSLQEEREGARVALLRSC
jgi:hypothetical protein